MELDIQLKLTDAEVRYWIEYAVLNGWKRPKSWSKMERQAAVMYGLGHHIGGISKVIEISYISQQLLEAAE